MKRRHLMLGSLAAAAPLAARAQAAWPTKPVRFIVPFAPGGGTDSVSRLICDQLGKTFGQSFVVDNKGGAGGNIGTVEIARARARRLHDRPDLGGEPHAQPDALHQAALRSRQGHHRDLAAGAAGQPARRHQDAAGQQRRRADRALQEGAGQVLLRLVRARFVAAPERRAVQGDGRRRHHPRALQGRRARPMAT